MIKVDQSRKIHLSRDLHSGEEGSMVKIISKRISRVYSMPDLDRYYEEKYSNTDRKFAWGGLIIKDDSQRRPH